MYTSSNDSEDEKTNDSDSDVQSNSDESGSSPPMKKLKGTNDRKVFKNKVLDILRKGTDADAGEFVIPGKLENAPMVIISVKVNSSPVCL